jgi:hypothetical protein
LLKEIKTFSEQVPQQPGSGGKQKEVAGQSMSRFGMANVAALVNIQEELAAKRMEALAARLGLAPEEAHIDVRRTAGGRCFGLLKFIVDIGFGIREVTATDIPRSGAASPANSKGEVDRGYFGSSANTAADILACMDAFKPSEVIAWSNGRLAFLDVLLEGIGASVRVCTKPSPEAKSDPKDAKEVGATK